MFLAINEMKQAKLRYGLIMGLLFLIAYLMFFLSGLSFGLMQENSSAVDKWDADTVLLSKDADASLNLSSLKADQISTIKADKVAPLAQLGSVTWSVKNPTETDKEKVSFFGIDPKTFLKPTLTKGRMFQSDQEVVIDEIMAEKGGFQLGDKLYVSSLDKGFTIVGYTNEASFSVAPVAYMTLEAFQELKYGDRATKQPKQVNAFIVQGKLDSYPKADFQKLTISDFITKLPGYSAQNLTFGFMIGFLIVISAIIIGIFMYVLTIQKAPIFGIMKAQGISNKTIANAVLSQTFILSLLGSSFGLLGTWLSSQVLPAAVPFQSNWYLYALILVAMVTFAVMGTLFSVLAIVRIDPLKAIG